MNGEDIGRKVASEFAESEVSTSPVHDGVNTLLIFSTNSQKYVVKVGTCNPDAVHLEGHILQSFNNTNIPTPFIEDIGIYKEYPYFIARFIEGRQLPYPHELEYSEIVRWARSVGRILAMIHQYQVPVGDLVVHNNSVKSRTDMQWNNWFRDLTDKLSRDARKNYPEHARRATRLVHWCEVPDITSSRSTLSLLDMHTHNLFVKDNSVVGVIDLERCYGGHPLWGYQTAEYMLCIGRSEQEKTNIQESFEDGYTTVRPRTNRYAIFSLFSIIREMRAAHMWWDDPQSRSDEIRSALDRIENQLSN